MASKHQASDTHCKNYIWWNFNRCLMFVVVECFPSLFYAHQISSLRNTFWLNYSTFKRTPNAHSSSAWNGMDHHTDGVAHMLQWNLQQWICVFSSLINIRQSKVVRSARWTTKNGLLVSFFPRKRTFIIAWQHPEFTMPHSSHVLSFAHFNARAHNKQSFEFWIYLNGERQTQNQFYSNIFVYIFQPDAMERERWCQEFKTAHSGTPNVSIQNSKFRKSEVLAQNIPNSIQIMPPHRWYSGCIIISNNRKRVRHTHTRKTFTEYLID